MKQRRIRVIPSLLLRNQGLYKGERFQNHKYVGDPVNAVRIFNEKEVDEISLQDTLASVDGCPPNFDLISTIASEAFMPMAYGGGITTGSQAERLFRIGIEKIILNTSALDSLDILKEVGGVSGAQSVMVAIDARRGLLGGYSVYGKAGTQNRKITPRDYALRAQDAGAGEILLTAIEREGTGLGYDIDLIRSVTEAVDIPVIAAGGGGLQGRYHTCCIRGRGCGSFPRTHVHFSW